MASIESTAVPLPIPPSSCEAPTKTVKQIPYVDNLRPLPRPLLAGVSRTLPEGRNCTFALFLLGPEGPNCTFALGGRRREGSA